MVGAGFAERRDGDTSPDKDADDPASVVVVSSDN
jgi:hypothetical protein